MFEWHRLSPTAIFISFQEIVHKYLKGFVKKKIQNSLSFPFAANKMEKWKRAEVTKCGFGRDTYGMPASIKCQGGQKLEYLVELLCRLRLRSFLAAREATTPLLTDTKGPHRTIYRPPVHGMDARQSKLKVHTTPPCRMPKIANLLERGGGGVDSRGDASVWLQQRRKRPKPPHTRPPCWTCRIHQFQKLPEENRLKIRKILC